eukprot:11109339-Alexandrium_andersonii.AAC.1
MRLRSAPIVSCGLFERDGEQSGLRACGVMSSPLCQKLWAEHRCMCASAVCQSCERALCPHTLR